MPKTPDDCIISAKDAKLSHFICQHLSLCIGSEKVRVENAEARVNERITRNDHRTGKMIWALIILVLTIGCAKLYQDYANQSQTISFLMPLKESMAVLTDHDKTFMEHLKSGGK